MRARRLLATIIPMLAGCASPEVRYTFDDAPADYTGELWRISLGDQPIECLKFSPDGRRILAITATRCAPDHDRAWVLDVINGEVVSSFAGHGSAWRPLVWLTYPLGPVCFIEVSGRAETGHITDGCFSPDGTRVATLGGGAGRIRIWDADSGWELRRSAKYIGVCRSIDWSSDAQTLVMNARGGYVLLRISDVKEVASFDGNHRHFVRFTYDDCCALVDWWGHLIVHEAATGEVVHKAASYEVFGNELFGPLFDVSSSSPRILAQTSESVWEVDYETGEITLDFELGDSWGVYCLPVYCQKDEYVLCATKQDYRFTVLVIVDRPGREVARLALPQQEPISRLAASPVAPVAATGSRNGIVTCWKLPEIRN